MSNIVRIIQKYSSIPPVPAKDAADLHYTNTNSHDLVGFPGLSSSADVTQGLKRPREAFTATLCFGRLHHLLPRVSDFLYTIHRSVVAATSRIKRQHVLINDLDRDELSSVTLHRPQPSHILVADVGGQVSPSWTGIHTSIGDLGDSCCSPPTIWAPSGRLVVLRANDTSRAAVPEARDGAFCTRRARCISGGAAGSPRRGRTVDPATCPAGVLNPAHRAGGVARIGDLARGDVGRDSRAVRVCFSGRRARGADRATSRRLGCPDLERRASV